VTDEIAAATDELYAVVEEGVTLLHIGFIYSSLLGATATVWLVPEPALRAIHLRKLLPLWEQYTAHLHEMTALLDRGNAVNCRFARAFGLREIGEYEGQPVYGVKNGR
jgi:hypothetical protein